MPCSPRRANPENRAQSEGLAREPPPAGKGWGRGYLCSLLHFPPTPSADPSHDISITKQSPLKYPGVSVSFLGPLRPLQSWEGFWVHSWTVQSGRVGAPHQLTRGNPMEVSDARISPWRVCGDNGSHWPSGGHGDGTGRASPWDPRPGLSSLEAQVPGTRRPRGRPPTEGGGALGEAQLRRQRSLHLPAPVLHRRRRANSQMAGLPPPGAAHFEAAEETNGCGRRGREPGDAGRERSTRTPGGAAAGARRCPASSSRAPAAGSPPPRGSSPPTPVATEPVGRQPRPAPPRAPTPPSLHRRHGDRVSRATRLLQRR